MTAAELCQQIADRRAEALAHRVSAYPRQNPIASDLGPCQREMVLAMTHWQERPLPPADLKARFERGNLIEDAILRELSDLGFTVRVERSPFEVKDAQGRVVLRGKIDGFVSVERETFPMEVKSLNPNVYNRVETVEDFDKFGFMAKYPRQLQSYLYANNLPEGFFLLDDCLGHWKLLPVALDWSALDAIIRHCEGAVAHREAGTLPDYHPDPAVCKRCWAYGRVCTPPMEFHGLQILTDPDFEADLNRRGELAEAAKEHEALDKRIKARVQGQTGLVVGDWLIQGRWVDKKGHEVKPSRYWQSKIERGGKAEV